MKDIITLLIQRTSSIIITEKIYSKNFQNFTLHSCGVLQKFVN